MILVKNIHGSGDSKPPTKYSSWRSYWEYSKGRLFTKCSNVLCNGKATDGGHVKIVGGSNKWYLVPLCPKCNNPQNNQVFYVLHNDLLRIE